MQKTRLMWAVIALVAAGFVAVAIQSSRDSDTIAPPAERDVQTEDAALHAVEPSEGAVDSATDPTESRVGIDTERPADADAPTHRVTGRVIDERRVSVQGARVIVLGDSIDDVEDLTDADGQFSCSFYLPGDDTGGLSLLAKDDAGRCARSRLHIT